MISIYREEIRDLLTKKLIKEAEDIWLQLIEGDPLDYNLFIGISIEFEKKEYRKDAIAMLSMVVGHLHTAAKIKEAVMVIKRIAELLPNDSENAVRIADFYRVILNGFPNLEKILEVSGITGGVKNLISSIELFEDLTAFKEGDFCKHNSWGIGQIKSINFEDNIIIVDFYTKKGHNMDISLAVKALRKIEDNNISVLKYKNIGKLKQMAENDPVELIRSILQSSDENKATMDDITDAIANDIVGQENWRKWWDKTKKLIKNDPYISMPEKKEKFFSLIEQPVSMDEKVLKSYFALNSYKEKLNFVSTKLKKQGKEGFGKKLIGDLSEDLIKTINDCVISQPNIALEAYYTLIAFNPDSALLNIEHNSNSILKNSQDIYGAIFKMDKIEYQKQAITEIKEIFKDNWADIYFGAVEQASSDLIDIIIEDLLKLDCNINRIKDALKSSYGLIGESEELLFWIAKNIYDAKKTDLVSGFASITLLEKLVDLIDLHNSNVIETNDKIVSRIMDLVLKNNCHFVNILLKQSENEEKLHVAKTIIDSCSFDRADKQSILAKFIISCPEVKELMKSEDQKSNMVYSSQEGYEKKQAEFYNLVNVLIPKNSQAINIARSYGDLRENFEYKAAKEEQAKLMRQKAELENLFGKIKIIDRDGVDLKQVSIATKVLIEDISTQKQHEYILMGIWDSEPEKGIISYLTPLAQSIIGKKIGETTNFSVSGEQFSYKIIKIDHAPFN